MLINLLVNVNLPLESRFTLVCRVTNALFSYLSFLVSLSGNSCAVVGGISRLSGTG